MKLELLPDEIFLDIFEYLDGIDIFIALYGLNSRFNYLLYKQYRTFHFRFIDVSKRTFDWICQQHLPTITDRVIALRLRNSVETPEQINRFYSYIPSLDRFIHLRSFSIFGRHSFELLLRVIKECQQLHELTHLNLSYCSSDQQNTSFQLVIDGIWSIPKLTNCHLDIESANKTFEFPTVISSSLQSLFIFHYKFEANELHRLFTCTPQLQNLHIFINSNKLTVNDSYSSCIFLKLTVLSVIFVSSVDDVTLINFFHSTPNLVDLTVGTWSAITYGHQWENIIRKNLSKLKAFEISMEESFYDGNDIEITAKELIDSFRSSFWTIEHQWYVHCYTSDETIYLETVNQNVVFREAIIPKFWQSTCPDANQQWFYDTATWMYHTFFDNSIPSNIHFSNIDSLHINLPINEQLYTIVPNLNKLTSVTINSYADMHFSEVQILLDKIVKLNQLTIRHSDQLPITMLFCKLSNLSVNRINLHTSQHYLTNEECLVLSQSVLCHRVKILSIPVSDYEGVTHLINNLSNLQTLIIQYQNDNFIEQLKSHLSSSHVIAQDSRGNASVSLWI